MEEIEFQIVNEIIRNETSLKGDECMKVERLLRERLKILNIRTCVHGCGEFDDLMKHYKEKHNIN